MRTTVTLDNDVVKLLRDARHKQHRSFKAVLNDGLRSGLGEKPIAKRKKFTFPTYSMGARPGVDITKANVLAAELEDEEILHKMALGK
jgi:hypothetical protein